MKCKSKTNKLEFFMTKNDELEFSSIIKKKYQDIVFIDAYTWDSKEVVLRNSISECYSAKNSRCVILNTKILSLKDYELNYIKKHPVADVYKCAFIGEGLIQFEHCSQANYSPGGLFGGFMASSYDLNLGNEMDAFSKEIFKICVNNGKRIYGFNPETAEIALKPEGKMIAWGDAIAKYDQANDQFFTLGTSSYYTSKYKY